ncbi:hypothetical protein [Nannocystis bainbridge]|uniref:Uncharacterized protein n=1 Tax=Nannocystis bainbridge TaxID=2995303 RepID=A0ABT5DRR4_9BACT|nr:hypothetical protein [Nannocystis bainbridge]MDC0716284.1 hypothetical protein [Nannocystis bainbridge]
MKPCSGCARHLRIAESVCPFCGTHLAEGTAPGGWGWAVGLALLGAACGTDKGDSESGDATTEVTGSTSSTTEGTTLTSAPTSSGTIGGTGTSSGSEGGETSTTECVSCSSSSEGGAFIYAAPDMGVQLDCDPWVQDCPDGQKCAPVGDDGTLTAIACVPAANPGAAVGEACTVQDQPHSGLDDCAKGLVCFEVDAGTLTGMCAALCTGSPDAPVCAEGTTCKEVIGDLVSLCL